MEASTTKENYKHADMVMATKIDRLERRIRELTKKGEELRDTSVRYRRDRDEDRARLDRVSKDRDRAWLIATGLANALRGSDARDNYIEMINPQEEARKEEPTQAERDEKIAKARASQKELAEKAKIAHAQIREMCLKDPVYRPGNGRTRADYAPAERDDYPRQPSPPRKRPNRGDTPNPFIAQYPYNRRRDRSPSRSRSRYGHR